MPSEEVVHQQQLQQLQPASTSPNAVVTGIDGVNESKQQPTPTPDTPSPATPEEEPDEQEDYRLTIRVD